MSYYIDSIATGFAPVSDGFVTILDAEEVARHNAIRHGVTTRLYYDNDLLNVFNAGCGCSHDFKGIRGQGECSHSGGN